MTTTLCEKYRAKCFLDIRGQELAIDKLKAFIKTFSINKKAALLYGPAGTGKTSLAYALAQETGSEILELNASDLRNREQLEKILKPATEQQSLTAKNKIILVDEVDGISIADRGGLPELLSLIEKTHFPMVITANDIWQQKFNLLRQKAELIQLKNLPYSIIFSIIRDVSEKEGLEIPLETLKSIAIKARGDVRAALNDLQSVIELNKPGELDERDKEDDIFNVLRRVFKEKSSPRLLEVYDTVNMPLDDIFLWVEENIPNEYKGSELQRAFDLLSHADVFRGRIHRQQHWRFLVYENALLSAGIASAKPEARNGFTSYKRSGRILKIWLNNQRTAKKKSISIKYASLCHISIKRAMHDFPVIKQIILSNNKIQKQLKLEDDEIEYLEK